MPISGVSVLKHTHITYFIDITFIFIQLICIIGLYYHQDFDYMRMAFGNLFFWFLFLFIEKKQHWEIPLYIRFITILSITFNDILGEYFHMYVTSIKYDRIQHIFGTYAITLWAFFVIQQFIKIKFTNQKLIIIFLICLSLALGSIYELIEFMEDELYDPAVKNQPSIKDIDLDLLSDLSGGIIAFIHYLLSKSLQSFTFPFEKN